MKKFLCIVVIIIIILSTNLQVIFASDNEPYSYIVIDSITGNILLEKNSNQLIYPASTTKILTAIVALENSGLTTSMVASDITTAPLESGAVKLGLKKDETMQLYDLLHALLLMSANDAAIMIAENISSNIQDFALLSNEFASNIGANNTHFVNPNGLHDDIHQTTAYDLAIIANYAMKNYTFSSIVNKTEYTLKSTQMHDFFPKLVNSNPILGKNADYNFLINGVKTGYTNKAKYVLVSSAINYDGREVICVVTGCSTRLMTGKYSLKLIDEAFSSYKYQSIVKSGDTVTTYTINNIDIPLASSKQVDYLLPKNHEKWEISKKITLFDSNLDIKKGDIKGEVIYSNNNNIIAQSYLVATKSYSISNETTKNSFIVTSNPDQKKSIHYVWFLISILWVIILVLIYRKLFIYKKHIKKEKKDE